MPGFTGCKVAMHGQTCLCLLAGALLLARSLNAIGTVFYSLPTHLQRQSTRQWRSTPQALLDWKWVVIHSTLKCQCLLEWMWSLKYRIGFLRKVIGACSTNLWLLRILSWRLWANNTPTPVRNLVEPRVSETGSLDLNSGLCLTRAACWISICRRLAFHCGSWVLFFLPWAEEHRASL